MKSFRRTTTFLISLLFCACACAFAKDSDVLDVMLQGSSSVDLSALVEEQGGTVTHDLPIISAVGAKLDRHQLKEILKSPLVTRHIDDLASTEKLIGVPQEVEVCKVRGHIELDFIPDGLEWRLYNKLTSPASMERLELSWPKTLGHVTHISIADATVAPALYDAAALGSLAINFPAAHRPQLKVVDTLTVSFEQPTSKAVQSPLRQRDFTLKAVFAEGCATDLVPGYENNNEDFYYNSAAGVDALHLQGITGKGVTVAVVDSGLWEHEALVNDTTGQNRVLARYDALTDSLDSEVVDESGHGTHMSSIIAHSGKTKRNGRPTRFYKGVAPDVNLVVVKVLDRDGLAHLLEIVRAIQWVVDNREQYGIRILNLSFAQTPRWPYWEDPVNQAVMKAWESGITVVAAAGNEGPDAETIGSPGNVPAIITVGAVTDSWTPNTRDDDYIPDFSSRGPTPSGHVKPDIVSLGGHMTGLIRPASALALDQPEDMLRTGEFVSTGTSQASALVSGIVALLLQVEPSLTPDEIKCRLITSAEPAINGNGLLAYTPFQQGHGYVTAARTLLFGRNGCEGLSLDMRADSVDDETFYGPAIIEEDGRPGLPGFSRRVSSKPSEKGFSSTRRWGVKDHVERRSAVSAGSLRPNKLPFDWQGLYLQEKAFIDTLARGASPDSSPSP
ncbi:MAG: S8 family peptidase [Halioglobus sp.]|nr:S8 family peptidase [Halioglobus sp.]